MEVSAKYYEINTSNTPNTTGKKDIIETAAIDNDLPIKIEVAEKVSQSSDKRYYEINTSNTSNTTYKKNFVETAVTDNIPPIKVEAGYY